jgi:PAS domain S-box-containing protein
MAQTITTQSEGARNLASVREDRVPEAAAGDTETLAGAMSRETALIALSLADGALWEWDFVNDRLTWDDSMFHLHGVAPAEPVGGFRAWASLIHPADRARFSAEIAWALSGQKPIDTSYRSAPISRGSRHIAVRARRVTDGKGRATRLVGVCLDQTAELAAKERLRRDRMIFDQIAEISGVGGWEFDVATSELSWSEQTRRIHEVGPDFKVTLENALGFYPPDARESVESAMNRCIETGERWSVELPFITAKGRNRWVCAMGCADFYDGRTRRVYGTIEDITERREGRLELVAAKEAAESANRAKTDFLAVISHELRTPLNGVLGLSDLLALGEKDPERLHVLQLLRNSGENLLAIINEILEFSRIDSGVMRRRETPFSVADVVERCVERFAAIASSKSLKMVREVCATMPQQVLGDPEKLSELLAAFISNACKFTDKGEVRVTAENLPSHEGRCRVRFRIDDTGIGIPPGRQPDLFKPFALGDSSSSRKQGGLGMGLALAKRLCDAMGGTIDLHSRPGRGTSVLVVLEFSLGGLASRAQAVAPQAGEMRKIGDPPAVVASSAARSHRILVAEDNPTNQALIRHLLRKLGKEFDLVGDGAAAVQAVRDGSYRVILMDVQMPGMSGIEATKKIRAEIPKDSQPWIIALTAQVFDEDRRQCFEAGMNEFLTKPARMDRLSEAIERGFAAVVAA